MNRTAAHNRFNTGYRFSFFGWGYFCWEKSNTGTPWAGGFCRQNSPVQLDIQVELMEMGSTFFISNFIESRQSV